MARDLDRLQRLLQYQFTDPAPAKLALTHRSASHNNNERLEFLGDALLDFIIGEMLYERFPEASEGELSRQRSTMVNKSALAKIGRDLHLGDMVQLGSGEAKSGGKQRQSILADTVEALIAAVYLDGGLAASRAMVERLFADLMTNAKLAAPGKDYKTRLQELMQAQSLELPQYLVVDTAGKAHDQTFYVECSVAPLPVAATGRGASKREAEQDAARVVLQALEEL